MRNRKGMLGLDAVGGVIQWCLFLAVLAIAAFLALSNLNSAGLFTAGSQDANDTAILISNTTSGITLFFAKIPTIFTILGAVVIVLGVVLIIRAVAGFGGQPQV